MSEKPIAHPYMLRSIELKDFKSIAHAKVDFHPLTVIVGANSSGKSSLIQSILALSQAVRSEGSTGRFPLNGELVRLGTFEETKNFKSENPESSIQITVFLSEYNWESSLASLAKLTSLEEEESYLWSLDLTQDVKANSGSSQIQSLSFQRFDRLWSDDSIETVPHLECYLSEMISYIEPSEDLIFVPISDKLERNNILNTSGQLSCRSPWWYVSYSTLESIETYNCDAAIVVGGIPHLAYTKRSKIDSYAHCWWNHAVQYALEGLTEVDEQFGWPYVTDDQAYDGILRYFESTYDELSDVDVMAVRVAEQHIKYMCDERGKGTYRWNKHSRDNDLKLLATIVDKELKTLSKQDMRKIANSMGELGKAAFRRHLRELFEEEPWTSEVKLDESEQSPLGEPTELIGSQQVRNFFGKSVKYLGPLRTNPRPLYDYISDASDLGVNGEQAAAILHTKADQEVQSSRHANLASALEYWLQEFGIADSSQTQDLGRFGYELKVSPPSTDRSVDLTSVGVGVSQVLPVLLICLISDPGDLIILEQPELHLHPALQHKLADFLLECTRSGRQILVETHSEHLINRLRRRVAEDDSDETQSLIGLLFAEQNNGQTTFCESKINTYGGLSQDWPDGFLDLGAREAQSLVRSSVYKHRRRQNRDEPLSDERKNGDEL